MNQKCEYVHEANTNNNKYWNIFKALSAGFYTLDVTHKLLRKSSSNSFVKKNSVQTVYIW